MRPLHRLALRLAPMLAAALALAAAAPAGAAALRLPHGWPQSFQLGAADQPGGAATLRARSGVALRYQYLAGGVDTGHGWSTWNPDGTFVTRYVRESIAARTIPVFTYYQLLQSDPARGGDEAHHDLANLRDAALMRRYWADFALLLRRAGAFRRRLVVVHLEPDMWGHLEQGDATALARRFARHAIALRDRLAPNVALAYHLSVWGTREDPTHSRPSLAHMAALGARSARFERALHARFDLVFTDVADRDAGFRQHVLGDGGATFWRAADFHRHARYLKAFTARVHVPVVVWQIPLGNSTLPDTWDRYRDTRVQWWLGSRPHLREERDAGVVALLFGAGADGNTTPRTDGGLFHRLARAYEDRPLALR